MCLGANSGESGVFFPHMPFVFMLFGSPRRREASSKLRTGCSILMGVGSKGVHGSRLVSNAPSIWARHVGNFAWVPVLARNLLWWSTIIFQRNSNV